MKKKICFFSFLLPFLSMMAIFIGNGIYPVSYTHLLI